MSTNAEGTLDHQCAGLPEWFHFRPVFLEESIRPEIDGDAEDYGQGS